MTGIVDAPQCDASVKRRKWLYPLVIVLFPVLAYSNSFRGAFIFDDTATILDGIRLRSCWPAWWECLLVPRWFAKMTFLWNYTISGSNPADYHLVNLLIHIGAALFLFGIIRRTIELPALGDCFRPHSFEVALASTVIWAVHPVTTSAVTYVSQRFESLMGMFYLASLYCFIRGVLSDGHHRLWYVLASVSCVLGMASKEVIVTAPIMILLYDRCFLSGSFRRAIRTRFYAYSGLALSWAAFAATVICGDLEVGASPVECFSASGLGCRSSGAVDLITYALRYGATQAGVVLHYLVISFAPGSLCLDYSWPLVPVWADAMPSIVITSCLAACAILACVKRPALGFPGIAFFLILAPTSSIMPRPDCAFDHRMYLPLAALVVLVVAGLYNAVRRILQSSTHPAPAIRLFITAVVPICVGLAWLTALRNRDYYSEETIWRDVVEKRPLNLRAWNNLGVVLSQKGAFVEADRCFRRVLQQTEGDDRRVTVPRMLASNSAEGNRFRALANMGLNAMQQDNARLAVKYYVGALRVFPYSDDVIAKLKRALLAAGMAAGELDDFVSNELSKPDCEEGRRNE